MPVLALAIAVAVIDQGIKYYIQSHMELGMSIPIINNILHLTYILNPGAAFGILPYQTTFFVIIASVMLATIAFCYKYIAIEHWSCRLGVGLLAGGAVGNVIDRVKSGYVVDYIDFRIWPVFNYADIAIMFGTGFIIYALLIMPREPRESPNQQRKRLENETFTEE